ncbi:MAG: hypothetical protein J1F01_02950 [Oscillospiraceae bacterium]|nr:hypothetical protein [Oscillospiraceae bacterium]
MNKIKSSILIFIFVICILTGCSFENNIPIETEFPTASPVTKVTTSPHITEETAAPTKIPLLQSPTSAPEPVTEIQTDKTQAEITKETYKTNSCIFVTYII